MNMCIYKYTNSSVEPEDESYHLTRQTNYCILLNNFTFVSQDELILNPRAVLFVRKNSSEELNKIVCTEWFKIP